jgi:hypothetical protein
VKIKVSDEAKRFLLEGRTAFGRTAFLAELTEQREKAVHLAIYATDPTTREVNAGRAQAWSELLDLFTTAGN